MKYIIKKIQVQNLISLLKKVSTMDTAAYLTIEPDRIHSDIYTSTKDVVKSVSTELSQVMEFEKTLTETIKLSFFNGSKLLSSLSYFDKNTISAEIEAFEEDGQLYAEKITFKDSTLKITIPCQDVSLGFTSLSEKQLSTVFDESNANYTFKLSTEFYSKLLSLQTLDKNEYYTIYCDKSGVHFKSESFDIIVDDTITEEHDKVNFFKNHMTKVDKEIFDVTICETKILLYSTETDTKLALNLIIID